MRYSIRSNWCILFLAIFAAVFSASCQFQKPSEKERLAENLAAFLKEEYNDFAEEYVMTLDNGSVFFADLDSDNIPEMFFLFDSYKNTKVMVYSIKGEIPEKLGEFDASMFQTDDPHLKFAVYQGGQDKVLYTQVVIEGGAADHRRWITDTFLTLRQNVLEGFSLSGVEDLDTGEMEHWKSAKDSTIISEEDYTQMKQDFLNGKEIIQTVEILQKDWIESFTQNDLLESQILEAIPDF